MLGEIDGNSLTDVKIKWKKNVVELKGEEVYRLSVSGNHFYTGAGNSVKEAVEAKIHLWLQERGEESSD